MRFSFVSSMLFKSRENSYLRYGDGFIPFESIYIRFLVHELETRRLFCCIDIHVPVSIVLASTY